MVDLSDKNKVFITGECTIGEFETVFKKYYRQLYLYAYGFVMDEMEAEDIVQEAFSMIWERRGKLPAQLDIRAYLYASVKHACLHYFRRLKLADTYKKKQVEALLLSCADDLEEEEEIIVRAVKNAMSTLSPQQANMIQMHINQGLTYVQIAEQLGLSENTVKTHIKRAYRILRRYLAGFFPGIPIFFFHGF